MDTIALVIALLYLDACTLDGRLVYEEFPQYGDREIRPRPNFEVGSCWARYETLAGEEEVWAYFRGHFAEETVKNLTASACGKLGASDRVNAVAVAVERGLIRGEPARGSSEGS